jgi:hypothetical protein
MDNLRTLGVMESLCTLDEHIYKYGHMFGVYICIYQLGRLRSRGSQLEAQEKQFKRPLSPK